MGDRGGGPSGVPGAGAGRARGPARPGRGLAAQAARAVVTEARAAGEHRYLHTFPSVEHTASNSVCRRAGFTLLGQAEFEYPKGHWLTSNDWRFDLTGGDGG